MTGVVTYTGDALLNFYFAEAYFYISIGWGTSNTVTGSAKSDVNLFQPAPELRVQGVQDYAQTHFLQDTTVLVSTIIATAPRSITEVGLWGNTLGVSPTGTTAATINATATTLTLIGAGNPGTPPFPNSNFSTNTYFAQLENEVVLVTGGLGTNSLTITRGELGSTPNTHAAGATFTVGGDGGSYFRRIVASNSGTIVSPATLDVDNYGGATAQADGNSFGGSIIAHADFTAINVATNDAIQFALFIALE